jgi:hypothetical protein
MTFTRLVTHYWAHDGWFADGELMAGAHRLAGIPGVLVHGRIDLGGPVDIPWHLSKAWPDARLELIDEAGHGAGRGVGDVVIRASDCFGTSYRNSEDLVTDCSRLPECEHRLMPPCVADQRQRRGPAGGSPPNAWAAQAARSGAASASPVGLPGAGGPSAERNRTGVVDR